MELVTKLWSYDHYVPLKELTEQFLTEQFLHNDEQVRKHIADYRNHLSGFYATTRIIDFINLSELEESEDDPQQPFSPEKYKKYYHKLKVKLKLDKKITELTLGYVNTLWQSIAEEFDLPSLTAIIDKIIDGSLVIAWLVLPHAANKIRSSISKALRFYQQHNIVEVHVDNELLYDEEWIVSVCMYCLALFLDPIPRDEAITLHEYITVCVSLCVCEREREEERLMIETHNITDSGKGRNQSKKKVRGCNG